MKLGSRIIRIFDRIVDTGAALGAAFVTIVMLIICFEVVTRYTGHAQFWTTEIVGYMLLYITFLGTAWVLKVDGHVRVDLLTNALRPRAQAALGVVSSFIGIIISLILVYYGTSITYNLFVTGKFHPTTLMLPEAPLYIIIPIGSLFLLIEFIRKGYDSVVKFRQSSE